MLENYTKGKTIKELRTEVEKARSDELAKQQHWELEKTSRPSSRGRSRTARLYAPGMA